MRKISLLATLVLVLSLLLAGSAVAVTIDAVGNPGDLYWNNSGAIAAAARNGNPAEPTLPNYGIAMGVTNLSTPGNTYNAVIDQWTYGHTYTFRLEYVTDPTNYPFDSPGGYTGFTVTTDANPPSKSNLFGGVADLFGVNLSFYTIRLNYFGNAGVTGGGRVEISDLKLNGVTMGTGAYDSGTGGISNNFVYFRYSDGSPFTNHFIIEGDFVFTGDGGTAYPGFEFDLSTQPVPLPPSILLLGSGLLGLGAWRGLRKS